MYFNICVTTVKYLSNEFCLFSYLFSYSYFFTALTFLSLFSSFAAYGYTSYTMGARDFSWAVSGRCSKICRNTEDSRYTWEKTSDTQGTPAVSPMGKWLLPTGKELFVCDRLSQSKNCLGKFPRIHRKEQKKPMTMTVPQVSSMG